MKFCVNSGPVEKSKAAVGLAAHRILPDVGLMTLRIGTGLCLVVLHGWSKLGNAVAFCRGHHWEFVELVRRLGFPAPGFFAVCAALSESVGAALVACGLYTRVAAATVTFNMLVAGYAELRDGTSIESAYLYGLPFFTVFLAGPGRLSLDYFRGHFGGRPAEQNVAPKSQQI